MVLGCGLPLLEGRATLLESSPRNVQVRDEQQSRRCRGTGWAGLGRGGRWEAAQGGAARVILKARRERDILCDMSARSPQPLGHFIDLIRAARMAING